MKPFWRTRLFWISVCSWIVTMGGHYVGVVPSPYGLVLANAVTIVYATLRCLQKRQAGVPWQGILFTSEFVGTTITMLINLLEALSQIPAMPPKILVGVTALIGFLATVLHHLSGSKASGLWDLGPVIANGGSSSESSLQCHLLESSSSHFHNPSLKNLVDSNPVLKKAHDDLLASAQRVSGGIPATVASEAITTVEKSTISKTATTSKDPKE